MLEGMYQEETWLWPSNIHHPSCFWEDRLQNSEDESISETNASS